MKCSICSNTPCICQECLAARNNGRHCAKLISPVPNPHPSCTVLHSYWDEGFKEGKIELKNEFEQWKKDHEKLKLNWTGLTQLLKDGVKPARTKTVRKSGPIEKELVLREYNKLKLT